MTDKATVQIGCPVAGRVSRKGEVGPMAAIGDELVVFATDAAASPVKRNVPVSESEG